MNILFTTSSTILSTLICRTTGEPVSHCVLQFGDYALAADMLGVRTIPMDTLLQNHQIVYSLPLPDDAKGVLNLLAKYDRAMYDYTALLYMGLRYLIPALPRKNLWRVSGTFLCTDLVTEYLNGTDTAMTTPYQLYLQLRDKLKE